MLHLCYQAFASLAPIVCGHP